jgi:hypothetical protein
MLHTAHSAALTVPAAHCTHTFALKTASEPMALRSVLPRHASVCAHDSATQLAHRGPCLT